MDLLIVFRALWYYQFKLSLIKQQCQQETGVISFVRLFGLDALDGLCVYSTLVDLKSCSTYLNSFRFEAMLIPINVKVKLFIV